MQTLKAYLPEGTTTGELFDKVDELNANPEVHGILSQHPVPGQMEAAEKAIALLDFF